MKVTGLFLSMVLIAAAVGTGSVSAQAVPLSEIVFYVA